VWAAAHPRREYWVGWSTARAILANRLVPGLLDRYLARTGFDAQQTDDPIAADRPHNLYEPVSADAGSRGDFDKGAATQSRQWRLSKARRSLSRAGSRREPKRRGIGSAN
jgi:hypothetical protein